MFSKHHNVYTKPTNHLCFKNHKMNSIATNSSVTSTNTTSVVIPKKRKVAVLMGSKNDHPKMQGAVDALKLFDIEADVHVLSAHRQPYEVSHMATHAREEGYSAFVCGAGMAAHLAGVVSAHTTLPVVGVPLSGSSLNGADSLYATVQMPKGIPVATVAIDNSYNAGILIAQMIGMDDETVAQKVRTLRNAKSDTC
jgi:5-(carboxyamino)imidazole ribonucleotide mutase